MKNSAIFNQNEIFENSYFKKHEAELLDLVENGQHPKALFIGCSDSRIVPSLITKTVPGELFVIRNIGNFVAPFKPDGDFHSTASAIEYAIQVLDVKEVIICGHTHCGAIASLYSDLDESKFIHTKKWLSLGEKPKAWAIHALQRDNVDDELLRLTEKFSVISQIENLLTYPFVKERVESSRLYLHGWIYDLQSGKIEYYDPDEQAFFCLESLVHNKKSK